LSFQELSWQSIFNQKFGEGTFPANMNCLPWETVDTAHGCSKLVWTQVNSVIGTKVEAYSLSHLAKVLEVKVHMYI